MELGEVLVVDDRLDIRNLIKEALAQLQVKLVDTASSGREALDKIAERSYELVLLDLKLLDMGGLEVLSMIKKEKPDIKVILISGEENETLKRATELGADGYLTKPFNLFELFQVLGVEQGKTV